MVVLTNIWKYSSLRFYWMNFISNISFWLFCEKIYKNTNYEVESNEFSGDDVYRLNYAKERVSKKRFVGYMYKNQIFLDNPGLQIKERDVWEQWKKKGLIKL